MLLGDEPALAPEVSYYQRLLARDQDEATQLVLKQARTYPPEQVYDELLVQALIHTRRDREAGELSDADEEFVLQATHEMLEDLGERRSTAMLAATKDPSEGELRAPSAKVRILACPARDRADRLALEMLCQLLNPAEWDV